MNYCEFFQRIEERPSDIYNLTVREFYEAEEHLNGCDVCYNRSERVLAKTPKEKKIGFNLN